MRTIIEAYNFFAKEIATIQVIQFDTLAWIKQNVLKKYYSILKLLSEYYSECISL